LDIRRSRQTRSQDVNGMIEIHWLLLVPLLFSVFCLGAWWMLDQKIKSSGDYE
jgi:hypothetical protein